MAICVVSFRVVIDLKPRVKFTIFRGGTRAGKALEYIRGITPIIMICEMQLKDVESLVNKRLVSGFLSKMLI